MPLHTDLQANYEHLRTAVEAAGVGTWDFNPLTSELVWSARCKELYGLQVDEPVSEQVFWSHIHPEDLPIVEQAIQKASDPKGTGFYEAEFRTIDPREGKRLCWVRATGRMYFDDKGETMLSFMGTASDITAQRLRHLQLQCLHDSPLIGILYWDLDVPYVLDANREYLRIVGRTPEELAAGQLHWTEMTLPEYRALDDRIVEELRSSGRHRPYTKEYARPDGTRVMVMLGGALVEPGSTKGVSYCLDLSAQQEAQRRSAAREREFRFLADTIPQIVWTADAAGINTFLNQRWTDYTGLNLAQSLGAYTWQAVLHPLDLAHTTERWRRSLRTGERFEVEYRLKARSGEYRWFLGQAEPLKDSAGLVLEWFGSCTDIHERKISQETLSASEERFRLTALASNDAIWDWDLETNVLTWTSALERVFSHVLHLVKNTFQWWSEHLHPLDAKRVLERIHAAVDHGAHTWQDEYRFRRPDGSYAFVLDRANIVRDGQGKALRMVGAMQDLSQQRLAEAALRQSQEELLAFADDLPQPVFMAGPNGDVHWCNQAWNSFTGTTAGELRGESWLQLLDPEHAGRVAQSWTESLRAAAPWTATFPLRGANGQYSWFSAKAKPTRDAERQVQRWIVTLTQVQEPASAG